jgi:hypothetical protein
MGLQVTLTGGLCVGLPHFPPFLDFPSSPEMPFCFSDTTKFTSATSIRRGCTPIKTARPNLEWATGNVFQICLDLFG